MRKLLFKLLDIFNRVSPVQILVTEVEPYDLSQILGWTRDSLDSLTENFVADLYWVKYFIAFPELAQKLIQSHEPILEKKARRDKQVRAVFKKEMQELEEGLRKNVDMIVGIINKRETKNTGEA